MMGESLEIIRWNSDILLAKDENKYYKIFVKLEKVKGFYYWIACARVEDEKDLEEVLISLCDEIQSAKGYSIKSITDDLEKLKNLVNEEILY